MAEQVIITRIFHASREKVWQAWTTPDQLKQWWSPNGFSVPTCELDVRPDGKMRIDMQGPDGTLYPSVGQYREVVAPERLVFTNSPLDKDGNPLFEVQQTIELSEEDGQTLMRLTADVLSTTPEAAPYLAGMEAGLGQALQKLAALVQA